MSFKQRLIEMSACENAIEWVEDRTLKQAWDECSRGDWMLWLLEEMEEKEGWLDKKEIMLLGCWCVRRVLKYVPEEKTIALKAIEAKEKWIKGEITKKEMLVEIDFARGAMHGVVNDIAKVVTSVATNDVESDSAWTIAWTVAWTVIETTANDVANDITNDAAWVVAKAVASNVTSDAEKAKFIAVFNKELLIQADYIRTQFTPPV